MFVIAHAGHWLANVLYAAPLIVLAAVFIVGRLRERGAPDGGGDMPAAEAGAERKEPSAPARKSPPPAPSRKAKNTKRR
jgi:hypothetical protein